MNENELNELAELLRWLEETLLTLQETEDPEERCLLVSKISRLFAEIERHPMRQYESPPVAACSFIAYAERFVQQLDLFPLRVRTLPGAALPFLS
jgi:hypothetical protein